MILWLIVNLQEKQKQTKMSNNKNSGGIGFTGLLTVLFIGLKLTNNINWSWWWVLSPLWIGFIIGVTLISIAILIDKK
jgi:hypothetical protein